MNTNPPRQEQQQGSPSNPTKPGENLIRNPLDKRRDRGSDEDAASETGKSSESDHDPGDNLIRNPLDKPGSDNLIDNPLDKRA